MFYELAASTWGEEERDAIRAAIASDRFTLGERVREFETEFARHFGSRYAVMVNSGSSANLIATAAPFFKTERPLQRGDEAIVPALVLGDDLSSAAAIRTEAALCRYRARYPQHGCEPARARADAANATDRGGQHPRQSSGAGRHAEIRRSARALSVRGQLRVDGRRARRPATGTFGDIGTFSLFFSHHISTIEGGVAVTDDEEFCQLMKALRAHGWTRDLPADSPIFEKRSARLLRGLSVHPARL